MQTVFDSLEWPRIVAWLESACQTGYGRNLVQTEVLLSETEPEQIRFRQGEVTETKHLIQRYGDISGSEPPDCIPTIRRLAKQGPVQTLPELHEFKTALKALRVIARFFIQNRSREETPLLLNRLDRIQLPNSVIESLEALISDNGELLASASPLYAKLSVDIRELQAHIRQTLQRFLTRPETAAYLQETLITQREGRAVLPVRAEHKVDVPGIVHATSATGSTLYIEPRQVVDLNNRLMGMQGELDAEIRRILVKFSEGIYDEAEALEAFVFQVGELDALMAKARVSLQLKANPVTVSDTPGTIHLRQARHPLLNLKEGVVSNDVILTSPHQILLITGPNTGGKTVLLKLIGLCTLMLRAGLHLPVAEGSELYPFQAVLADIGDPQSMDQNLSTFSGHIERMKTFLVEPELAKSLILVDEICAGTDPQEGVALAKSLLQTLGDRHATAIVTTHMGELKVFAHQHHAFLNASVEFDAESLKPTYKLLLGVPGTSHALNIALRLGLNPEVVETARNWIDKPDSDTAELIEALELKNRRLNFELDEAQRLRAEIQWEEEQMRTQLNRIEGEKKKTLELYRESLKEKMRFIEREVDELKSELKQEKVTAEEKLKSVSGRFKNVQNQAGGLFGGEGQKLYPHPGLDWKALKVGDRVQSRSLNMVANVVDKNEAKQEITLAAGILKTTVPFSDLIKAVPEALGNNRKRGRKPVGSDSGSTGQIIIGPKSYAVECDVRGMNTEDAIGILEKFLDDAMLTGAETVGVIHGMGTGVLKNNIRGYLKKLPYIKAYGPAEATDGGDGKTWITL